MPYRRQPTSQNACQYHRYSKQTIWDNHFQCLKSFIIAGWPSTKDELHSDLRLYWSYRDELAVTDEVVMKGRYILTPSSLKQQVLDQLHTNHMGIEKTKLLACESVYWADINADVEKQIKNCTKCLEFQEMQPKEKIIHHDIPLRPWKCWAQMSFILVIGTIYAL